MDKTISPEQKKREKRKQWIKISSIGVAFLLVFYLLFSLMENRMDATLLRFSAVDKGAIEVTISAGGKVIPAFEEILTSPISSQIVEIYSKAGDSVDIGTPILRLDLQAAEVEYRMKLDEERIKELRLKQQRILNANKLSEMAMNLKVLRMELDRKAVEVRNEQYLDSLGAGTPDKVREMELAYHIAQLKLQEDEQKYKNEQTYSEAELELKELELTIFRKSLAETRRILNDSRIVSPRKAVLTYVNDEVGATVGSGTRIAVVSDLSHFKIAGEIPDGYGDRFDRGSKAIINIGSKRLMGYVSDITPLSKNGVISFTVQLDESGNALLRSGLKVDVYLITYLKADILRIKNAPYYHGPGNYELFVRNQDRLERRKVRLGESNVDYVEVIDGLQADEEVVILDMTDYKDKQKIKLK